MSVSLQDIKEAHKRISPYIHKTPVLTSQYFDEIFGFKTFFKCENFQKTGSFKIRGATNAVFSISDQAAEKGVITHSSGNHGAALAQAALWRGVKCYVVTPHLSPEVKKKALQKYKAEVTFSDVMLTSREEETNKIIAKTGSTFIHPYDNDIIIAGQGTSAFELLREVVDLDYLFVPIGGGGGICGSAIAAKSLLPNIKVIGGEPELADDAYQSFKTGILHPQKPAKTIADGLRTALSERTFGYIKQYVDDIVTVTWKGNSERTCQTELA